VGEPTSPDGGERIKEKETPVRRRTSGNQVIGKERGRCKKLGKKTHQGPPFLRVVEEKGEKEGEKEVKKGTWNGAVFAEWNLFSRRIERGNLPNERGERDRRRLSRGGDLSQVGDREHGPLEEAKGSTPRRRETKSKAALQSTNGEKPA